MTYDEGKGDGEVTRWTLEIRIFDLDAQHPIVEGHVRMYASFLPENQHLQVCRLLRPDDRFDSSLSFDVYILFFGHISYISFFNLFSIATTDGFILVFHFQSFTRLTYFHLFVHLMVESC